MLNPFLPFLVSAAISWVGCLAVFKFGKAWGIVDDPRTHKHPKVVHDRPVPRGGGIPIFLALVVTLGLFGLGEKRLWGVVLGALVLAITGFVDDKYEEKISPYLRLVLNGLAAVLVIASGVGISYVTNPFGGVINLYWVIADVLAFFWLVGMQNIVGWSSGVDGQMPGFVIIAAVAIVTLGTKFNVDAREWAIIALGATTAGAYLGFLPWNWYPQKIIPGYGGKSLAGFLLGVLAIFSGAKVGAMAMILGIPFIDAIIVLIKRISEGRSPVWGGYEHLHHLLLSRGWGKRRIALLYWGVSAVLGIAALQLNSTQKWFTMALVGMLIGGTILWLHYLSIFLKRPDRDSG